MRSSCALLLALALTACAPPEERLLPLTVQPVFDPSSGQIPTPNDLVRDGVAGHLALPLSAELPGAEKEFRTWLNGLDGWPTATPAKVKFGGALDPAHIDGDGVRVFEVGADGKLTLVEVGLSWSEPDALLTAYPVGGWKRATRYLIGLRGGTKGLRGTGGAKVVAPPAFFFLRAGKDLREHPRAIPGAGIAQQRSNAAQLEVVRQGIEPLLQKLVEQGWARDDLALAFAFTTTARPELRFDPLSSAIPLPNDLLLDPKTGLVAIPAAAGDSPEQAHIKRSLSTLDGFAVTGLLSAETTGPIPTAGLRPEQLRLFELTGELRERTDLTRKVFNDGTHLFGQPRTVSPDASRPIAPSPLRPATQHAWIVTSLTATDGSKVSAQPLATLLRLKSPLVLAGKSQVSALTDGDAAKLEPLRARMQPLLDKLEAQGVARDSLLAAVPFTTMDIHGHMRELLATAESRQLSLAPSDVVAKTPLEVSIAAAGAMLNVTKIINGEFETFDRIDPVTQAFSTTGPGTARRIKFTFTYPANLRRGERARVVVFGQGLTTERRLSWFLADRLAREGIAVFAFDFPFHGERSSCTTHLPICSVLDGAGFGNPSCNDSDPRLICTSGQCGADGRCVGGDFNRFSVYNFGSFARDEPGTPFASGAAFVNVEDLGASRDHFRQTFIDLGAAYRFVKRTDWASWARDLPVDVSDVRYTGISLGGILGGVGTGSVAPIRKLALNVPGGGLVDLFTESATFGPVIKTGLRSKGIELDPPNLAGWSFIGAAHWLLDDVDPMNIADDTFSMTEAMNPETGQVVPWAPKQVLIQMGGADTIIPNSATYRLRDAIDPQCKECGAEDTACVRAARCSFTPYTLGTHIFVLNPAEAIQATRGQNQLANFLGGN